MQGHAKILLKNLKLIMEITGRYLNQILEKSQLMIDLKPMNQILERYQEGINKNTQMIMMKK